MYADSKKTMKNLLLLMSLPEVAENVIFRIVCLSSNYTIFWKCLQVFDTTDNDTDFETPYYC